MTENQGARPVEQELGREQEHAHHRAGYHAAWARAVETLTEAARLRRPRAGRPPAPVDFAEFVTSALAAVAANVGSVDRLLAGRPGSWEAAKLGDLLYSTVGYAEEGLARHRTEPVVIHLNVHRLVVNLNRATGPVFYRTPWEQATEDIADRYADLGMDEYDDAARAAEEAEQRAADQVWAARYAAYAAAFTAAVHAEAAHIEGLRVSVRVEAETAPDGAGDTTPPHPEDLDYDDPNFDPLALQLWDAARRAVTLPASDADQPPA